MYIPRSLEKSLHHLAEGYPIVAITGPRQSGKTTLARHAFPDKPYASLEDPDLREAAESDPRGFLARFPDGAILDEAQRCPTLFSYLQSLVDRSQRPGMFLLTGSQQFGLLSGITQSLAGRVALTVLLPFSLAELKASALAPQAIDPLLLTGGYPPIYDRRLDPWGWYGNYVRTYVERDVRQLVNIRDLRTFQRFLRLCAGRIAQLANLSALATECGISHNTAKAWLSVLEASYIVYLLQPHHRNFNKRLVKTPKLYFHDTGLAAWLLGIRDTDQLNLHPLRGALFESWVVSEMLKQAFHNAEEPNLYFWRDRSGHEIDLLIDRGISLQPIEIKSGATLTRDLLRGLHQWRRIAGDTGAQPLLVYAGDTALQREGIDVIPWSQLAAPLGGISN